MSIIFFLTEGMLRLMKINVSFGPSSGTDMSNFRPWLMDYVAALLSDRCPVGETATGAVYVHVYTKSLHI